MATLPSEARLAMRKWLFRADLEDLDDAFANALQGLSHREDEIEAMVRRQLGLGANDLLPDLNPDDPDDPVALIYEHAGDMVHRAQRGAHILRKTFLIALFHLYERHNPRLPLGLSVERRMQINRLLDDLRHAANCAKHPTGGSALKLYERRPDLFPLAGTSDRASERTLVIHPDTFNEFFEAVWSLTGETR